MWNSLFYPFAAVVYISLAALNTAPAASVLLMVCAIHLGVCAGCKFDGS